MDEVQRMSVALQALIESGGSRSKMSFLRKMLPQIEAAQQAGITHEKILQTLNEQGFGVPSQKTYAAMLSRARIKTYGATRYSKIEREKKVAKNEEVETSEASTFTPKEPGAPKKLEWDLEKNNAKKLW